MSQAQQSQMPDDDALHARSREQAEAEAAASAVMTHVAVRAAQVVKRQERAKERPKPLKAVLLLVLIAFNLYVLLAKPEWLRFKGPPPPTYEYYQSGWKTAAAMREQRVEESREREADPPARAEAMQKPVRGVDDRLESDPQDDPRVGTGPARVFYDSREP